MPLPLGGACRMRGDCGEGLNEGDVDGEGDGRSMADRAPLTSGAAAAAALLAPPAPTPPVGSSKPPPTPFCEVEPKNRGWTKPEPGPSGMDHRDAEAAEVGVGASSDEAGMSSPEPGLDNGPCECSCDCPGVAVGEPMRY